VTIGGIIDSTVGVSVGSGARLKAVSVDIDNGYIGMEIRSSAVDTILSCTIDDASFIGLWFCEGTYADTSAGNRVKKDSAGSLDYGILVTNQSIDSNDDEVDGGFSRNFRFSGSGHTADLVNLAIAGTGGADYGMFLDGTGATTNSAVIQGAEVDDYFDSYHMYIYGMRVRVTESRFVSSGDSLASPYGIWEQWGTGGAFRCCDVLHQATSCVYRSDTSCHIAWDGAGLQDTAGYNALYSSDTAAYSFTNNSTVSVDAKYNWWGGGTPKVSGSVDTSNPSDSGQCGPTQREERIAAAEDEAVLPEQFALEQNIPNPFNPTTEIRFALPKDQPVTVVIYNILGRSVRRLDLGDVPAGYRSVIWDGKTETGRDAGSGVYFYRLVTPEFQDTKKMLLLK
jgi:hypothetical protein